MHLQSVVYRKLSALVERFGQQRSVSPRRWARELFRSLDWGGRPAFDIREKNGGNEYDLLVDSFPLISVVAASPDDPSVIYPVLNKAYNADIPWVVATDFWSLGLFGTRWVSFPHDVYSATALRLRHSEYLAEAHHLALLTPQAVSSNVLDSFYSDTPGRKQRLPIDLLLVERMARWRNLALDALRASTPESDQVVHRLINALLLLRYLEDIQRSKRNHLKEISKLEQPEFLKALLTEFQNTARKTGYNVPRPREMRCLEDAPIRELIHQMYGYPELGIEYDFASMTVDILGRFYEEYLRYELAPAQQRVEIPMLFEPPPFQLDDVRRHRGVYFTPRYMVDHVLNYLISRFSVEKTGEIPFILDFAAGSGTFLTAALDHLSMTYTTRSASELSTRLIGFDIDARAVEAARLNLTLKVIARRGRKLRANLSCIDLIAEGPATDAISRLLPNGGVDIIVSNPPFIRYERLKKLYDPTSVFEKFETATGRTDSYIMFAEAAVTLLREGGLGGLVLPRSILKSSAAGRLREWFARKTQLLEIIDYGDQQPFQSAGSYVCIVLFRKESGERNTKVTVGKIHKISGTPASQLAQISTASGANEPPELTEVFLADQPTGRQPWDLRSREGHDILARIKGKSIVVLGDALILRQGIKTGADDIFILGGQGVSTSEDFVFTSGGHRIERGAVLPVLRNRDLRRWLSRSRDFLIFPYDRDSRRLLRWTELADQFPCCAEYLESKKNDLQGRRSLRGKSWYALIEPRLDSVMESLPRLVVAENSLLPTICRTDPPDSAIVGSAWLFPKDDAYDLDVLLAYLSSSVVEWYLRQVSSLLQGGYLLIRQTHLESIPLPEFLADKSSFVHGQLKTLCAQMGALCARDERSMALQSCEAQMNSLIMQSLGLTMDQAEILQRSISVSRRTVIGG